VKPKIELRSLLEPVNKETSVYPLIILMTVMNIKSVLFFKIVTFLVKSVRIILKEKIKAISVFSENLRNL